MLQGPSNIPFLLAHGAQRVGEALPTAPLRAAVAQVASLVVAGGIRAADEPDARRTGRAAVGMLRALKDAYALVRDRDGAPALPPVVDDGRDTELMEARLLAVKWRDQAEAAERRIAELEAKLAVSEMTALDLRSRVVCLHGKLATTTATARYQTLALALEAQQPGPAAAQD